MSRTIRLARAIHRPEISQEQGTGSRHGPLAKIIEEYRARQTEGLIFRSSRGKPLNLENFARRTVRPLLEKLALPWYGWHAFRRGLATNLNQMGVDPKDVQAILRPADFQTTMNYYVKAVPESVKRVMERFETLMCTDCASGEEAQVV